MSLQISTCLLSFFTSQAYFAPEDVARVPGAAIILDDPDVERVRRAHLNDLENLVPFFAVGFLFVLTDPNVYEGTILIRIVAWARILHTIVYAVYPIRQPARGICFFLALLPTVYMAFVVMVKLVHF